MTGDCQTGDTSGDDGRTVNFHSSRIRTARSLHADGAPDMGKLISLDAGMVCQNGVWKTYKDARKEKGKGAANRRQTRRGRQAPCNARRRSHAWCRALV